MGRLDGWNGILGAPTLAKQPDAELEVVVGTAFSGLCAYDLSDSAGGGCCGRPAWEHAAPRLRAGATGRDAGRLDESGDAVVAGDGDPLRYLIALRTAAAAEPFAATLTGYPAGAAQLSSDLWVSTGSAPTMPPGTVHWVRRGESNPAGDHHLQRCDRPLGGVAQVLRNTAVIHSAAGGTLTRSAGDRGERRGDLPAGHPSKRRIPSAQLRAMIDASREMTSVARHSSSAGNVFAGAVF